jgi:glycosylphosphatidylinositol transamidase (GPIT) subunit GPI8
MLGYFNWIPRNVCHQDSEDIIKIVDGKGLLTLDMIQVLYKEYASDIHRSIAHDEVFEIKEVTIKQEYLDKLNLTSLNLINPEELEVTDPVDEIVIDEMVTDELIEAALTNINRKELKSELIELEKSEEDLAHELYGVDNDNIEASFKVQPESNNNQIEETNGDDFEWF